MVMVSVVCPGTLMSSDYFAVCFYTLMSNHFVGVWYGDYPLVPVWEHTLNEIVKCVVHVTKDPFPVL